MRAVIIRRHANRIKARRLNRMSHRSLTPIQSKVAMRDNVGRRARAVPRHIDMRPAMTTAQLIGNIHDVPRVIACRILGIARLAPHHRARHAHAIEQILVRQRPAIAYGITPDQRGVGKMAIVGAIPWEV